MGCSEDTNTRRAQCWAWGHSREGQGDHGNEVREDPNDGMERAGQKTPTWSLAEQGWGQGSLTHNLPDSDRLSQSGRLAAPCNVDPNDPENDSGSCGKILDGEATALNELRVSRDPFLRCERGVKLGSSFQTFLPPPQLSARPGLELATADIF